MKFAEAYNLEKEEINERVSKEESPNFIKAIKGIESLRQKFDLESDLGVLLGIYRDLASALRRGTNIDRFIREIQELEEDIKKGK